MADSDLAKALAKLVHSPLTAMLVQLSPNKVDDAVLEILKGLVPKPE